MLKLHKKALGDFGPIPFKIVSLRSRLRINPHPKSMPLVTPILPKPLPSHVHHPSHTDTQLPLASKDNSNGRSEEENQEEALGHLIKSTLSDNGPAVTEIDGLEQDEESAEIGRRDLGPQNLEPETFAHAICSRVLKDPFHVFNMIYIS
ncbi:hypothetical protein GYMLUDRAFT_1004891 [Collybiopsis luxurians FD-317 M1]|uniref:Uncharacterized protein n=1 Tax=Collybiopsis luxurians FD-317 M1 TaxID=944289 RepID=A0A0D0CTI1_9AGAR|nr:hypothetical protein GYMLUDRAFT_1004891 [Collybiopsis luxurians FD-317 M1]